MAPIKAICTADQGQKRKLFVGNRAKTLIYTRTIRQIKADKKVGFVSAAMQVVQTNGSNSGQFKVRIKWEYNEWVVIRVCEKILV
jgi:hypothetical protein